MILFFSDNSSQDIMHVLPLDVKIASAISQALHKFAVTSLEVTSNDFHKCIFNPFLKAKGIISYLKGSVRKMESAEIIIE